MKKVPRKQTSEGLSGTAGQPLPLLGVARGLVAVSLLLMTLYCEQQSLPPKIALPRSPGRVGRYGHVSSYHSQTGQFEPLQDAVG